MASAESPIGYGWGCLFPEAYEANDVMPLPEIRVQPSAGQLSGRIQLAVALEAAKRASERAAAEGKYFNFKLLPGPASTFSVQAEVQRLPKSPLGSKACFATSLRGVLSVDGARLGGVLLEIKSPVKLPD
jgi:hypothetical protein